MDRIGASIMKDNHCVSPTPDIATIEAVPH